MLTQNHRGVPYSAIELNRRSDVKIKACDIRPIKDRLSYNIFFLRLLGGRGKFQSNLRRKTKGENGRILDRNLDLNCILT